MSPGVKTKSSSELNWIVMSYQIKFLNRPDSGIHLVAITWGLIDTYDLKEMLDRLAKLAEPLLDCKIFIDLEDANCALKPADISCLIDELRPESWPENIKMAI